MGLCLLGVMLALWSVSVAGSGWVAPVVCALLLGLGVYDLRQTQSSILRNYPVTAHHIVRRINDTEVRLLSNLVMRVKEGSLLTDLDSQHEVFKLYWPRADAHSFAVRKPDDKVSSTGELAPAAA